MFQKVHSKPRAYYDELRQIAQDPANYVAPSIFNPDRFLGENPELDPHSFVFGFGRRRCPGIELARTVCLLMMATTLSVLDIVKAKDQEGREQTPPEEFISSTVWYVTSQIVYRR